MSHRFGVTDVASEQSKRTYRYLSEVFSHSDFISSAYNPHQWPDKEEKNCLLKSASFIANNGSLFKNILNTWCVGVVNLTESPFHERGMAKSDAVSWAFSSTCFPYFKTVASSRGGAIGTRSIFRTPSLSA